jgi:NAD(P)H-nitrite reductase large subunit
MDQDEEERRKRAIIESYKVVCICHKIRRGVIQGAIDRGATTIEEIRRRTRAATGPCGSRRCGPVIRRMLAGAALQDPNPVDKEEPNENNSR